MTISIPIASVIALAVILLTWIIATERRLARIETNIKWIKDYLNKCQPTSEIQPR